MMSIEVSIKHGNKFAYDLMSNDDEYSTREGTHWSIIAARAILGNLSDRRGIGKELDAVDDDIRQEIVETLAQIISSTESNREVYTATDFSKE